MADEKKPDAILADLIRKRDDLNTAIRILQETIGTADSAQIEIGPAQLPQNRATGADFDPLAVVFPGMFYGKSQPKAAKLLLEQVRPRPLQTKVIAACLEKGGLKIGGKKPLVNLWSTLDRDEDFLLVPKAGWTLAEWHSPSTIAEYRKKRGKKGAEEENNGDEKN